MSTARKLAVAGAAAAVVAGVGASPAVAATDPDLLRFYSAASHPGAQAAIQNAVSYGDRLDSANKKAHDAWLRQVAAYNKALAKYKAELKTYNQRLPMFKASHKKPPAPPKPPKAPPKTGPALTDWAQFGRIGTVGAVKKVAKKTGDKWTVSVTVTGIQMAVNGSSAVTFSFDDDSSLHSLALRDEPTATKAVNLVKTDELDIKVGDKIGVIGTLWGSSAIGGLVVVKTL
ncbi:MAG: hypothetical protein ACXV5Q_16095 [Frankiaceae bacterium]